jgi:hypothetical protein
MLAQPGLQRFVAREVVDKVVRIKIRAAFHERRTAKQKEEIFVLAHARDVDTAEIKAFQSPGQRLGVAHAVIPVRGLKAGAGMAPPGMTIV